MAGRPARIPDHALAERLERLEADLRISQRQMARMLAIEPSTYCRCRKARSFSAATKRQVESGLSRVETGTAAMTPDVRDLLSQILRLSRQLSHLLAPLDAELDPSHVEEGRRP